MEERVSYNNHHDEIIKIKTEFSEYKKTTNQRLDEILEKLKPQFSNYQITTFLLSIFTIMGSIMLYITSIKSDTRQNSTKIESLELVDQHLHAVDEKRELQFDNIMIMLTQIQVELKQQQKGQ
jgi:hypothetical protein